VLAEAVGIAEIFVVLIYLFVVVYLGWLGYSQTKTAADYLIAGFAATSFWLVFLKAREAEAIRSGEAFDRGQIQHPDGLSQPNWPAVDPYYSRFANIDHCDCCCQYVHKTVGT